MSSEIIIVGNWFEAGSTAAVSAQLILHDAATTLGRVVVQSGEGFDVEIESISDRVGTIDRRIDMRGGHAFVTADNDGVDRLSQASSGIFSKISGLESFHPRLIVFLLAAAGLVYAFVIHGLPVVAKMAAWATPPQMVTWMDTSTLSTLDQLVFSSSKMKSDRQIVITEGFARLAEASQHNGKLDLLFRNGGPLGPNALALPGGTIVLTDQLAELGTEDEILAVLAHEISHVQYEHSLQQLYRALGFAGMIALVAGDLGAVAEEVLSGGGVLVAMAASREMELEADEKAVGLLFKVNIDPINLSTMLDKLYASACKGIEQDCADSGWLSSHPGGEERREALIGHIESN